MNITEKRSETTPLEGTILIRCLCDKDEYDYNDENGNPRYDARFCPKSGKYVVSDIPGKNRKTKRFKTLKEAEAFIVKHWKKKGRKIDFMDDILRRFDYEVDILEGTIADYEIAKAEIPVNLIKLRNVLGQIGGRFTLDENRDAILKDLEEQVRQIEEK